MTHRQKSSSPTGRRSEFQQIADLFVPLTLGRQAALGLKDDAAVLAPPAGCELVVTVDAIVEGVHYLPSDPPELVARKLVRVNLSDLAAMGAGPAALFLACAFPKTWGDVECERFASGLALDLEAFSCPVLGGDTVSLAGPATFSLTALGWVPQGEAIRRDGARPGDVLVMTGSLGDGALGLKAARGDLDGVSSLILPEDIAFLCDRYHLPRPRLSVGQRLRSLASAGMDVSDGLLQDLGHLCRASNVGAHLFSAQVPLSVAAHHVLQWGGMGCTLPLLLTGGDDYELLLAIPPENLAEATREAESAWTDASVPAMSVIGVVTEQTDVLVFDAGHHLVNVASSGWQHF